jgi:hypothetical protein
MLYVDKPEAGCETLPITINVRIMTASLGRQAYNVLEAESGDTVREERVHLFNLCDKNVDSLTGIVVRSGNNDVEDTGWTPDIGNDFGEAWEKW